MDRFEITTLIDITNSGAFRPGKGTDQAHNQYRNWITLTQCLGLRSIIQYDTNPTVSLVNLDELNFGSEYKGIHRVWKFLFYTDRVNVYSDDSENPIGLLLQDLDQVPIIKNLNETINISKAVFDVTDPQYKNTNVRAYLGL